MIAKPNKIRQIGRELKAKTGRFQITGRTSGGGRWPDLPHYWIIDDCRELEVFHVAVDERASWKRYSNCC